jgi:hypothetical protein
VPAHLLQTGSLLCCSAPHPGLTPAPTCVSSVDIVEHALNSCNPVCAQLALTHKRRWNQPRLEQLVVVFKKKLAEKADAEESWHVFRHVIEDMTAMVRNHPKELPPFFAGMAMKAPAGSSK